MRERFDAIVIGTGTSGNAAAYTLAKAGLKVIQIERRACTASVEAQCDVMCADELEKMVPDFRDDAPLERRLTERCIWVLDHDFIVGTHHPRPLDRPGPGNRYAIHRFQFDAWFSRKAREAGAAFMGEATVDELLTQGHRCVGVRCAGVAELHADVVILADGLRPPWAPPTGTRAETDGNDVKLAVKETLFMPSETIEQRFNVLHDEGVFVEMMGKVIEGMAGTGFLYTHQESVTVGFTCVLNDFKVNPRRATPYGLLEIFKRHPSIAPLIEGGEMKEYCAQLVPERSVHDLGSLHGDGWLIVGDCAHLAMTSGRLAAETVIAAKRAGKRMTEKALRAYPARLHDAVAKKDRGAPRVPHEGPQPFMASSRFASRAARSLMTVGGIVSKAKQRELWRTFSAARDVTGLMGDALKLWRAFR
jgi:electron transfer flavoprotein-quinone oxidoreductase